MTPLQRRSAAAKKAAQTRKRMKLAREQKPQEHESGSRETAKRRAAA